MLHLPKYLVELQVQDDVDKVEWEPGDSENQDHSNKQPEQNKNHTFICLTSKGLIF